MPKIKLPSSLELTYEVHGAGRPLLLLPGTGYWHWCWFKQIPLLSRYFQIIALNHRGVGGSDLSPTPYTLQDMAHDAAQALDALGIEHAHVLGTSMGGFVAQELALLHPEKVDGLVLVCTSMGGPEHVLAPPHIAALLVPDPNLTPEGNLRRGLPGAVAPGYFEQQPEELEEIIRMRLEQPVPREVSLAQVNAVATWSGTADRLADLSVPTLVVHGNADMVVPVVNGQNLAEAIEGAELRILPGAGHLCFIERAPMFNRVVAEFLQGV